jgi:hypothetical protein
MNVLQLHKAEPWNELPDLILDPRDAMAWARQMLMREFTDELGRTTLHRYRGEFWQYRGSCYRPLENEDIKSRAWLFLEQSKCEKRNVLGKFKPTGKQAGDLASALEAVCALDNHIHPPIWLNDSPELPSAGEFFAVANGLLHLPTGDLDSATPEYFNLCASDVVFDIDPPPPLLWHTFLAQLFGDDTEAKDTLQDVFGYALAPAPRAPEREQSRASLRRCSAVKVSSARHSTASQQTSA